MRLSILAAPLALLASTAAAQTVDVRAGRLIDPASERTLEDQRIRIVDGRIESVQPWSSDDKASIDWSGYTVLPGLIDMHTHVADGFEFGDDPAEPLDHREAETALKAADSARRVLHAGFTTVRDVGAYRGLTDVSLRNAIANGWVEGPRMFVAGGYITIPGGGGAVTPLDGDRVVPAEFRIGEARTAAEARQRVAELLDGGADFIKLIATGAVLAVGSVPGALELTPEQMKAACDEAKARGSYCIAHAHGAEGIKASIRSGARTIEHASYLDSEGIEMAKAAGVWLAMDVFNGSWIDEVGTSEGWPEEYLRKNRETTDIQRQAFEAAVKAGAKLVFASDSGVYPHGLGGRQFAYMVRYGMTPMQAIRSATAEAARALGKEGELGSVAPGSLGDLIAVTGDPLADIRQLEHVDGVIKGGELVR